LRRTLACYQPLPGTAVRWLASSRSRKAPINGPCCSNPAHAVSGRCMPGPGQYGAADGTTPRLPSKINRVERPERSPRSGESLARRPRALEQATAGMGNRRRKAPGCRSNCSARVDPPGAPASPPQEGARAARQHRLNRSEHREPASGARIGHLRPAIPPHKKAANRSLLPLDVKDPRVITGRKNRPFSPFQPNAEQAAVKARHPRANSRCQRAIEAEHAMRPLSFSRRAREPPSRSSGAPTFMRGVGAKALMRPRLPSWGTVLHESGRGRWWVAMGTCGSW